MNTTGTKKRTYDEQFKRDAVASVDLDALFEVPERFGIGDVVADAQAEEVFK
ncbi:MAG: hypothetical protein IAE77_00220, partial [Prosthecobacter sp.]|nr:hypothetical protein [Prosthecobacter sp.]